MASGCERSASIFILLHLVFLTCKPVEDGRKRREGEKYISTFLCCFFFVFLFTCSARYNCFDVIWLKVMCVLVCDCVYLLVIHWFQRQPQGTDVASPNPDIKGFGEFWPALSSTRHSLVCQYKCNVGISTGTLHHCTLLHSHYVLYSDHDLEL